MTFLVGLVLGWLLAHVSQARWLWLEEQAKNFLSWVWSKISKKNST